jgi:hypothetical protein
MTSRVPPLSYRWVRFNGINRLLPWEFVDDASREYFDTVYYKEALGVYKHKVYTFARRVDCDDLAAFVMKDNVVTDRVVYFHPGYSNSLVGNDHLVNGYYDSFWEFFEKVVIPESKDREDEGELV